MSLKLIGAHISPFVRKVRAVLAEKNLSYEHDPMAPFDVSDEYKRMNPLGKVPVLLVDDDIVLFESSVIAEYIDEVSGSGLLATEPLEKARQRSWIEFASSTLANIAQLYNAASESDFANARRSLASKIHTLEATISSGNFFSGADFSLVDAAFAPVFRYFDVIEALTASDFFKDLPKLRKWRTNLAARPSVQGAVASDYAQRLSRFLAERNSVIGNLARPAVEAAA